MYLRRRNHCQTVVTIAIGFSRRVFASSLSCQLIVTSDIDTRKEYQPTKQ